ncbi:MAG: helix-turn-helix transcriptional regulator [Acidimicrobiia bacterium]
MAEPERLLRRADLARELGLSKQRIHLLNLMGRFPEPDYVLTDGTPLWRRRTLESATIIPPKARSRRGTEAPRRTNRPISIGSPRKSIVGDVPESIIDD